MVKKCKIAKKTRVKLEWLRYNYNSFYNISDLKREFCKRFDITPKHAWRIFKIYDGIANNTTNRSSKTLSGIPKEYLNRGKCYFCPNKNNLIEHHISYAPEVVSVLCKGCHAQIHKIMKIQHECEIKKVNYIKNIKGKLKEMMESL